MHPDERPFAHDPRRGRGERGRGPRPWRDFPDEFDGEQRGHGRHDRMERGTLRYVLLDALRDGPKHGYEVIKSLEERTGGRYAPSPGTVYPTLQYLDDLGFVRAEQADERRVYAITDAGRAELIAHDEVVRAFWSRFTEQAAPGQSRAEVGFVRDEFGDLTRTVWEGVRGIMRSGDHAAIREIRLALERCKNDVREIIARSVSAGSPPENGERR
jgi:DNA-binding PadR family transcriptional regulator